MVALEIRKVRGSILIGVLATTAIAWGFAFAILHTDPQSSWIASPASIAWAQNLFRWTPAPGGMHALLGTAFKLDIRGALNKGLLEIVFVFFFVDLFDNLGTLVAVTKRAGLIATDHSIPRLNRILFADATATVFGSLCRHVHRHQLCGINSRRHGWRPQRHHRHRHRIAFSRGHCRRSLCRLCAHRRHRSRAHPRRFAHAGHHH